LTFCQSLTNPLPRLLGTITSRLEMQGVGLGEKAFELVCYCFFMSYFLGVPTFAVALSFLQITSQISAYRSGHGHSLYPFNVLDPLWRLNHVLVRVHIFCTIGWLGWIFRYQSSRGIRREGKGD